MGKSIKTTLLLQPHVEDIDVSNIEKKLHNLQQQAKDMGFGDNIIEDIQKCIDKLDEYREDFKKLTSGKLDTDQFDEFKKSVDSTLSEVSERISDVEEKIENFTKVLKNIDGEAISKAFDNVKREFKSFKDNTKSAIKLLKDFQKLTNGYTGEKELRDILTTIEDINSASENFLNLKNVKASKKDLKSYENELTELYDRFTVLREIMSDPGTSVSVMKNAEKQMSEIIPKMNELTKKIAKANKTSAAEFKDFNTGIKINSSLGVLDIDDILTQIDDEYDTLKKHLLMRSEELQEEVNKIKGSTTTANTFTFEKDGIKIPVMLSPEGLQKCKDDLDELITILKEQSENNPVDVSIRLFPLKSSKEDAKEVGKYIKDIRAQIPNEASGELKEKLNGFVDKFAEEYQKALELNIKVNLSDTPKGVEKKVKAIQTAVNKNKIKIKPTFIIDKNQAQKLDDQFKEIRGDFTFDLTGQLDKMATSINEMLDNSNVDTWSSSFKAGLEKIKPVLEELNQLVAPLVELTTNKKQNRRGRPSNEDIANRNYVEKFTNAVDALNKALNLYDREIKHSEDIGNKLINSIQSDINSGDDYVLVPIEPDINGFLEKIEDALTSIKLNIGEVTFSGIKGGSGTPITIVSTGETVVENNSNTPVEQKSEGQKKGSTNKSKTKPKSDFNKWASAETDGMDEEFANVYFGKGKRKRGSAQEKDALSEVNSIIGQYTSAIQNVIKLQKKIEKTQLLPGDSKAEKKGKSIENRDKSIERAVAKVKELEELYPILKSLNNKNLRQLSDYDKDVIRDNYLKSKGIERTKDYSANSYFAKLQQEVALKGKFNLNKSGNKQALTDIVQRFIGYKNRGGVGLLTHLSDDTSVLNKIINEYNKIMGITKKIKDNTEDTVDETERYVISTEELKNKLQNASEIKKRLEERELNQDYIDKIAMGNEDDIDRISNNLKGLNTFKKRIDNYSLYGISEIDYGDEKESLEDAENRLKLSLNNLAEKYGLEADVINNLDQKTDEEIREIAKYMYAQDSIANDIAVREDIIQRTAAEISRREEEAKKKKESKEKKKTKPQKTKAEELEEETEDTEEETAEINNKEAKEENKEAKENVEKKKKLLTGLEKKALNQRKKQERNNQKTQNTLEFNRLKDVVASFDDLDLRHADVKQNFKDVASQFYDLKQKGLKFEITDLTSNVDVQKKLKKVYDELAEAIRKTEEAEKSESETSKGKATQFLSEKNAIERFTEAYEEYFELREKINSSDEKEKSKATTGINKLLTKFPTLSSIGNAKKEDLNFDEQLNAFMATQKNLRKVQDDATKAKEKDTKAEQDNIDAKKEGNKASDVRVASYKTEKNAIKGFTEAYEEYFKLREKVNNADEKGKTKATEKMDKLLGRFPTLSSIGDTKKEDINFDEQLKTFMATQDEINEVKKKSAKDAKDNAETISEESSVRQKNAQAAEEEATAVKKSNEAKKENVGRQSIQSELQKIQGKYNSDSLYQSLLESGKVTKNSTIDEFTKYSEIGRNYSDEIYNLYRKNLQILETADKKSKEYNDALKMNRDLLIELSKFGMNADGERLWIANQYASKSDKDILDDYNKAIKSKNGQAKDQRTAQIRDALEARGYDVTGTDKEIYNRLRNASKQDTSNVDAQTDALEREKKEVSALIDELYRLKKIQDSLSIDDFLEGTDITVQQVETGGQLYKYFGITDNPLDTINPDYFAKQYNEKYGEKYNLHDEGKKEASQWTEGVKEEIPNSENAGVKLADATAEGAMDASEEHSPSKVADRLGQYWGIGWKEGLEKTKPEIIAAITDLMDAAKAAAKGVEPLTEQDLKDALIDFGKDPTKWEDYNALRSPLRNILDIPKRVKTKNIKKYFNEQEAKEQLSQEEQPKQKVETTQQEAKAEEQKSKFIGLSKEQLQDCLAEEEKWLARCKEGSANYEKRKAAIEEIKSLMSGMDDTSTTEPPKPKAKEKVDLAEVSKKQISQILEKFENNEVDTLESFYKLDQIFERNTDVLEQMGKGEDAAEFKKQFEEARKRILTELLRPIAQKYLGEDAEFNIKESVRRQGNKEGNPKFKSYRIQGEKDYVTVDPFGNLIGKDKNVNESLTQSKQAKKEAESLEKQVKKAEEDVQKAEENLEKSKKKLADDKQKYQNDKEQKERDNLVKEYEKKAAQQQKENEQLERERTKAEEDVRKAQENLEKAQKKLAEDEQKYQDSKDQKNRNELTREYDKKETQQQRDSEQREKEIERARANAQKAQENLEKSEKKLSEDEQKYQDNKAQKERDALVKEYEKKTTQQQKEIEQREKEIEKSRAEVQKAQEALEKAQKRQSEIEEEKQRKADRQKYDKMYADYDKKEQQQKVEAEGQRQAQINSILDERLNAYKEIWNINKEISKLDPTTDAKQISELEKQRQDYGDIFTSATRLLNVLDKQAITEDHINQLLKIRESAVNEINRRQSAQEDNLTKEAVKEQEQRSKKYLGLQGRLGSASYDLNFELGNGNPTPEFAEKLQNTLKDISVLTDEIEKKGIDAVSEQDIKRAEDLLEIVRQIRKEGKLTENRKANENSIQKNLAQINSMLSDNTKLSFKRTDVYKDLVSLQERFKNFDTSRPQSELAELTTELLKTKARFEDLDNTVKGKNLFQTFIERIHGTTAQLVAQYLSWMDIIRYIRTMATTIIDLDTQLVDLRKTTTMTTSELNEFYNASSDIAKTLGVTTSEIISQSAAWSRLGYSSKEAATEMAQLSSKFASISPGMTTDNSTDYLVSTMQAYGIAVDDVERKILDNVNRIGNILPKHTVTYGAKYIA